ncbi:terminase small subunit [Cohnella panacarvi]|uniref:terminase small subunit n=1 Tax=Cohnella panacarvi TaxID=400776 RepID=UPI00047ED77F|nr:terminase small subunit [Cohnella panacarvi]
MSANKLTAKRKKFADEYLKDLNGTKAAMRAGYSEKTANEQAARLLANASVQEYLQKRQADRAHRTEITQDMVLQRLWAIATADPNELVHLRRLCCRHCFGIDHAYHWRDEAEYAAAVQLERDDALANNREPNLPTNEGGYGYDKLERPHPKCPQCRGEGRADLHMADTRDVSESAKLLYAGVKSTQAGIEIKLQDQQKALELVARHLGMFNDKLKIEGEMVIFKGEEQLLD